MCQRVFVYIWFVPSWSVWTGLIGIWHAGRVKLALLSLCALLECDMPGGGGYSRVNNILLHNRPYGFISVQIKTNQLIISDSVCVHQGDTLFVEWKNLNTCHCIFVYMYDSIQFLWAFQQFFACSVKICSFLVCKLVNVHI